MTTRSQIQTGSTITDSDKRLSQSQLLLFLVPIFILSILFFFRLGLAKVDGEPRLDVPTIGFDNSHFRVSLRLKNAFSPTMDKTIESGKKVSFHFQIELFRARFSLVPDQKIWTEQEIHIVTYDAATREYSIVITRGSSSTTKYTSNPEEMKNWVNSISFVVPDLFERSNEDKEYYARAWSFADTELLPGSFKTQKIFSKKFVPQRLYKKDGEQEMNAGS